MWTRHRVIWMAAGVILVITLFVLGATAGRRLFDGTKEVIASAETERLPDDRPLLTTVRASPDHGFQHPYFLLLPETLGADSPQRLLVEPNNTGTATDEVGKHQDSALRLALRGHARSLADRLGVPLLVPGFPRPEADGKIYTHALDRDTLLVEDGSLERLDLQLLAMTRHARRLLSASGISTRPGLWMHGFSASGSFVNRFAALHPTEVRAVAGGGLNALPILPRAELEGAALPYPIGVSDLALLTSQAFDSAAYGAVAQLIYMGELDRNDTLPYGDAWSDEERNLITRILGKTMMPDRWRRVRSLLAETKPIQCRTYDGAGHEIRPDMLEDISAFFLTTETHTEE